MGSTAVNWGYTEGTIDSELFGHEKGAFTELLKCVKVILKLRITELFLDEVADLPLPTQADCCGF